MRNMFVIIVFIVTTLFSCTSNCKTENDIEFLCDECLNDSDRDLQTDENDDDESIKNDIDADSGDEDISEDDRDVFDYDDTEKDDFDFSGCVKGVTRKVKCSTDRTMLQNQICNETGDWEDKGKCYCESGGIINVDCSTDSLKLQKRVCDENGEWKNEGDCFEKESGEMVDIPAGKFWMGCNEIKDYDCLIVEFPYHEVFLPAYKIDKYEVTVSQYLSCVEAGKCNNDDKEKPHYVEKSDGLYCMLGTGGSRYPVNCISWYGAKAYCEWVGKRLPTEAEWEKAARGTDGRTYPWGSGGASCFQAVIFEEIYDNGPDTTGCGCGSGGPWAVGSKPDGVSPYGVYDMSGNVYEWCSDWYDGDYYSFSPSDNPTGPKSGKSRVVRGGYWCSEEESVRASYRDGGSPDIRLDINGFRCAK